MKNRGDAAMYQLAKHLVNPYFVLLALLGIVLACLWYRRRESRWLLWLLTTVYVGLLALGLPVIGHFALRALEGVYPPLERRPDDVGVIVVLAGGDRGSFYRCLHAARLYRGAEPCLIICSCDPEAQIMRDYLVWLGVRTSDIIMESNSANTFENAMNCSRLLEARQVHKIVLVTDSAHMPRACAAFRKQGLDVVPAGCASEPATWDPSILEFLPNSGAVHKSGYATQEGLGMAWYWARGRI